MMIANSVHASLEHVKTSDSELQGASASRKVSTPLPVPGPAGQAHTVVEWTVLHSVRSAAWPAGDCQCSYPEGQPH